jgi:hypothetical protein
MRSGSTLAWPAYLDLNALKVGTPPRCEPPEKALEPT